MIEILISLYFIINIAMLMIFAHELYPQISDMFLLENKPILETKKHPDVYVKIAYICVCIIIVLFGLPVVLFHLLKEAVLNYE